MDSISQDIFAIVVIVVVVGAAIVLLIRRRRRCFKLRADDNSRAKKPAPGAGRRNHPQAGGHGGYGASHQGKKELTEKEIQKAVSELPRPDLTSVKNFKGDKSTPEQYPDNEDPDISICVIKRCIEEAEAAIATLSEPDKAIAQQLLGALQTILAAALACKNASLPHADVREAMRKYVLKCRNEAIRLASLIPEPSGPGSNQKITPTASENSHASSI